MEYVSNLHILLVLLVVVEAFVCVRSVHCVGEDVRDRHFRIIRKFGSASIISRILGEALRNILLTISSKASILKSFFCSSSSLRII